MQQIEKLNPLLYTFKCFVSLEKILNVSINGINLSTYSILFKTRKQVFLSRFSCLSVQSKMKPSVEMVYYDIIFKRFIPQNVLKNVQIMRMIHLSGLLSIQLCASCDSSKEAKVSFVLLAEVSLNVSSSSWKFRLLTAYFHFSPNGCVLLFLAAFFNFHIPFDFQCRTCPFLISSSLVPGVLFRRFRKTPLVVLLQLPSWKAELNGSAKPCYGVNRAACDLAQPEACSCCHSL